MSFLFLRPGRVVPAVTAVLVVALPLGANPLQSRLQGKYSEAERQEIRELVRIVDAVVKGEPAPSDLQLSWHTDFLRAAQEGQVFVPFTVSIDREGLTSRALAIYYRVVSRGGPAGPNAPDAYPYEDVGFFDVEGSARAAVRRVSRAFQVAPGEYEVYLVLKERTGSTKSSPRVSLLKQSVTVPDFWNGELATSSVIVADRVEPLKKQLSEEEQREQPYTIGTTRIIPAPDDRFGKGEELSIIFLIYNPALEDNRPDIQVEYLFHQKTAEGEKYFNKTPPTVLNAQTVPPEFNVESGQLPAGQSIPLGSFPPGDYRLEIKVTDKLANRIVTRDVLFTVQES